MTYNADERYREIQSADSSEFSVVPAEDLIDFSESWDLPTDVNSIVRIFDKKKCKVIERSYKTNSRARKFIESQLGNDDVEVTSFDNMTLSTNYQAL
jgi:hypothetical protein